MSLGIVGGKQQVVAKGDAAAVVHIHLHWCQIAVAHTRPKGGKKEFGVANSDAAVVDVGHILAHWIGEIGEGGEYIHAVVVLMIARHDERVSKVVAAPVPEWVLAKLFLTK